MTLNQATDSSNESTAQIAADIAAKIEALNTLSGENLKDEMHSLKKALLANPAATLLLKDEDIGELVKSLRRITGEVLSAAQAAKPAKRGTKEKPVKLSAADLQAALNSEDF